MREPDAESSVRVASEADAKSVCGSRGSDVDAPPPLEVPSSPWTCLGGHRTACTHCRLIAARANIDITHPSRSVLLPCGFSSLHTWFSIFRGKPIARTTAMRRPQVAGRLTKVVHLWTSICAPSTALGHTRQKHHWVDEPDIAALPPSSVRGAQMPPGPRADQPIDDDDELSNLEFSIANMMAPADAANMEENR